MDLGIVKFTINQLVLSGIHLGQNRWVLNNKVKPFLIGYKHSLNIINLYFTGLQLKTFLNFLFNIVSLRQKVLIVKESSVLGFKNLFSPLENVVYFEGKWVGGFLTNFKTVRRCKKLSSIDNKIKFMPSVVILYDASASKWALYESSNLEIPIFSIINTDDSHVNLVNYPVVGNNSSYESLYFYSYLFRNAILKGIQKERLNILRII